ncbi:hypothetical protein AMTR_s00001p00272800 [Amborella trichopoda]|uniref:Uncharacterized protein n=1 Tax=Amborella trichopoda TaxID=13333 RepID=W1NLJ9_AMBTC|nr:hypothetical protein AMTR_s00001p00272800 [Amborella trichopoda]
MATVVEVLGKCRVLRNNPNSYKPKALDELQKQYFGETTRYHGLLKMDNNNILVLYEILTETLIALTPSRISANRKAWYKNIRNASCSDFQSGCNTDPLCQLRVPGSQLYRS